MILLSRFKKTSIDSLEVGITKHWYNAVISLAFVER